MSTVYTIENELLKVSVTTWGAQVCSVKRKCDGVEHIWQADKSVWGYHAPILFPYAGKLAEGKCEAKDTVWENAPQHGFARTSEHRFVRQNENTIVLELTDSPETLALWPYKFRLTSYFILDGDKLTHRLEVENRDEAPLPFGIGYHPAFTVPFGEGHTAADYEFRFEKKQSPLCVDCLPNGLVSGKCYYLGNNIDTIPLTETLFANDSFCMTNLTADTLGIYEKGTGRGVVCDISGFPYTLIWSKPTWPTPFVCIEPWHSLPSAEGASTRWEEKPAAAVLQPGEKWHCDLNTRFVR